ncbi:MAG: phosphoribosyltransferase family protein [Dehalogenimonas sp.]|uniref:Phosphoribosyltransferase family protein n=1 Tax=Candidatus Dehalogenimonas loeffleri TaxID=3127115 RepID=A0ABZ2JAK4_9CHLR|nr:phosphoribosyltransferase family protein [Dehalogenimonas sp.]
MRIINRNFRVFKNRGEAGRLLARELSGNDLNNPIVLGVPRGGVIVGAAIAEVLQAELDIVISRKLRVPQQPELAFGALAENGSISLNESLINNLGISRQAVEHEINFQRTEIGRRQRLFRTNKPKTSLLGRSVILTDDGIATGETFRTALEAVKLEHPVSLTAALPVGPESTVASLAAIADDVICWNCPPSFNAVGQFYEDFREITDAEVLSVLSP